MLKKEQIEEQEGQIMALINKEFKSGFDFIKKYPRTITFYGSAQLSDRGTHFKALLELAGRISKELDYTIVTGGGPGVMEAANRGAKEAGGKAIGISIKLPHEQTLNKYLDDHIELTYFFVRRTILAISAEAFIFGLGGFGTLDELFEILTLVQTKKVPAVPIILFGKDYWEKFDDIIKNHLLKSFNTIESDDVKIYHITDSQDEVIDIIKKAPLMNWWESFER